MYTAYVFNEGAATGVCTGPTESAINYLVPSGCCI